MLFIFFGGVYADAEARRIVKQTHISQDFLYILLVNRVNPASTGIFLRSCGIDLEWPPVQRPSRDLPKMLFQIRLC